MVADWTGVFVHIAGDGEDGTEVLRVSKMCRYVRIFRLLKLGQFVQKFSNIGLSSRTHLLVRVLEVIVATVFLTHLVSCAWYAVGRDAPSDTERRWIRQPVERDVFAAVSDIPEA